VSHNPDPQLQYLIQQQWPTAQAAGHFFTLPGLSGQSARITSEQGTLLARRAPQAAIPFVERQREYRLLQKLQVSQLAPRPFGWRDPWLLLEWLPGEMLPVSAFSQQRAAVVALLQRLHQQPLTGYRLNLTPLLQSYWQMCPHKHWRWQRRLQRLMAVGEPHPLRLAPIHMDVHAGNLIVTTDGLRLIDWEYAADGDVALELAAICAVDPHQQTEWVAAYAQTMQLAPARLQQQIRRWQPWLHLLMASWYQLRAEQTQDETLQQLARASWQDL